jgi:type III pantothenate kinase
MILAIDIGNTQAVFAVYDDSQWSPFVRIETAQLQSVVDAHAAFHEAFDSIGVASDAISHVGISSVVPDCDEPVGRVMATECACQPVFVSAANAGIAIDYPHAHEIGADRLANAVGALESYAAPLIIVDCGTAITYDFINAQGAYCGGPIAPGILMSQQALTDAAAKLPPIDFAATTQMIPDSTPMAMQAGLFVGTIGAINHTLDKLLHEVGGSPQLIATGGLAPTIVPHLRHQLCAESTLTLDGARVIAVRQLL